MTRTQEFLVNVAACSAVIVVVTQLMTDRTSDDWRTAGYCVVGVLIGFALRWNGRRRQEQRAARAPRPH